MAEMKKIIIILVIFVTASTINAQTTKNGGVLDRINMELSVNSLQSPNFYFGSGLLKGHPERAVDLTASVRLWQHVEIGGVLSLQGASQSGHSGIATIGDIDYYYLGWDDNRYHLGGGIKVQLHLTPFDKRYLHSELVDLTLRGGWGLGGQVEGFWFGAGEELRLSRQLVWTISADYGQFPFADLKQVAGNESAWRFCTGLKISLK